MEEMLLGVTDRSILVWVPDPAGTTGTGKTGLAHSAVTVSYTRVETDNDVTVTDVTSSMNALTNLTDAHNDWGWKEVSSTLAPGLYRLDVADAVFAAGAWYAVVQVTITSGLAAATPKAFRLVAVNALDAVRMGLTALPNAAADAAGGLPISDAGGLDLDAQRSDVAAVLVDTGTTLDGRLPAALVGGRIDANVGAISADATAADNAESFFDGTGYAGTNNVIPTVTTVNGLAAGVITAASIANGAIDAATFAADVDAEILSYLVDDATRIDASALNTATGTTIPAILTDTAEIGAAGAGLAAIPWNASWDAEVQSEVDDALVAHRLDELLNADSDIDGAAPPTVGSVFHELMSKTAGSFTFDQTTDALEALRDRGDAAWATATGFSTHGAADVWGVATRVLTAGTNIVLAKDTGVTGFNDLSAAQVNAEADTALADIHLDHLLAATYDPAAKPGAADALLNELVGNDGGASQFTANALELAPTGGSAPTAAQIRAEIDSNSTQLAAIVGDTNELQADWADGGRLDTILDARASQASVDVIDGVVDSILADTGTDGVVLSAATANQIADALLDRTAGVETNRTLRQALRLILATAVGKLSGAATTTVTVRDTNDGVNRVVATVDESGNRSAVTLDAS